MSKIEKKYAFIFVAFLLIYEFSVYIANDMIMPGMIHIVKEFSASDVYIPRSLTAFILGGASLQIFLGPLSDRYGRRKIMLFGVTLFVLSTIANGLVTSINQFMVTRFFQGMGVCYIGVIGYATIQEMFEEKKAVKIISIMTTVSILAPLIGPLSGSIFLEYYNWRGINLIIALFSIISLVGLYFYFPGKNKFKLIKNKEEVNSDKIYENIFKESFKNYSLIIKNKKFMAGVLAFSMIELPLIIWIATSPIVLIRKASLSQFEYGLYQIPIFSCFIIGVVILQKLLKKYTLEKIILLGTLISGVGLFLSMISPIFFAEHFLSIVVPYSIYAIGVGLVSSPIYRLVLFASDVAKGSVAAAFSVVSMIFFGLGTELMGIIYRNQSNILYGLYSFILFVIYYFAIKYFIHSNNVKSEEVVERKVIS